MCLQQKHKPVNVLFCRDMLFGRQRIQMLRLRKGGHGLIDLHEAFASSCNPYFIELGIKIGPNNIIETANKFGFGKLPVLTPKALKNQPEIFQNREFYLRRHSQYFHRPGRRPGNSPSGCGHGCHHCKRWNKK